MKEKKRRFAQVHLWMFIGVFLFPFTAGLAQEQADIQLGIERHPLLNHFNLQHQNRNNEWIQKQDDLIRNQPLVQPEGQEAQEVPQQAPDDLIKGEGVVSTNRAQALPSTPWDINRDLVVDIFDLVIVGNQFGKIGDNQADVNGDKIVNIFDLVLVGQHFGEKIPQKQEFIPLADVEALLPKLDSFDLPAARRIAQWFREGKLDEESIQLVQQKTKALIKELTNPDPRSTKQGRVYPIIKNMGPITTQPLIDNAFDLGANTDTRKWSLELLGHVGQFEEVFSILLQVINGDPRFEWWHIAEAESGMEGLLERQSKDRLFELKSHPNPVVSRIATNLVGDYVPPQAVPPKPIFLEAPAQVNKLGQVFKWQKDPSTTKYHLQILKKGEARPTVDQVTDRNEYTLPSFLANGEYQIRVAGLNAKGEGEWAVHEFKVDVGPIEKVDPVKYQNWLANNEAMSRIGVPHSFIGADPALPDSGEGNVLKHGLVIYDWALAEEFKLLVGDIEGTSKFIEALYWAGEGAFGNFGDLTAYYDKNNVGNHPFVYIDENKDGLPDDVNGDGRAEITRPPEGWIFKILKADGLWNETWDQWHPIAGENAWVDKLASDIYLALVANGQGDSPLAQHALSFAIRNAEPALLLQQAAKNGGIPMGPIGTWFGKTDVKGKPDPERDQYFHLESAENNISWHSAFKRLYAITGDQKYKNAMDQIESYLASLWMEDKGYFAQGNIYNEITKEWELNRDFATDVQTWIVLEMGGEWVNQATGSEAGTYKLLKTVVQKAGVLDAAGNLIGVDFNDTKTNRSIEWTAFAILAERFGSSFYQATHADWAEELSGYADSMHRAMYALRIETENTVAFHYSTHRAPTGFGWIAAGPIESLASTMAMALADQNYNPFSGEFIPLLNDQPV